MKHGYVCECGWRLSRGSILKRLTRQEYAEAKRNHATGINPNADHEHQPAPCGLLKRELKRTQKIAKAQGA